MDFGQIKSNQIESIDFDKIIYSLIHYDLLVPDFSCFFITNNVILSGNFFHLFKQSSFFCFVLFSGTKMGKKSNFQTKINHMMMIHTWLDGVAVRSKKNRISKFPIQQEW